MRPLRRALGIVWESARGWTVASAGLTIVQGLLPLAGLYLTKLTVDAVAEGVRLPDGGAFTRALLWVVLAAAVALIAAACRSLSLVVGEEQSQRVTDHVMGMIHTQSAEVDLSCYEDPGFHDAAFRAQQESPYRPTRMVQGLTRILQNGLSLLGVGGLLLLLHWGVAAATFLAVVPGVLLKFRHAGRLHARQAARARTERRMWDFHRLLTDAASAKEVRVFDLGGLLRSRYQEIRDVLRRDRRGDAIRRAAFDLLTQGGAILSLFGLLGFVAWRAIHGAITLGEMVMYFQAFTRAQSYLQEILGGAVSLREDSLYLGHLDDFLSLEQKVAPPPDPTPVPRPMKSGFTVEDVSFRYPAGDRLVLDRVRLSIRPGEVVALVGDNGSGKTTLARLLCRLQDPTAGRIVLDGSDLRDFDPRQLRREVSVVFQDHVHYPMTAGENIWLGDVFTAPGGEGVRNAARRAGAESMIEGLPQGYETLLGKHLHGGVEISVGEWQKVALARAFLRDAQLVVLDEPTSALSPQAEAEVFEAIRGLLDGRAALLISHRFSTVRMADRICVLERGRIVEQGSHDELLHLAGRYAGLYETQARNFN